MTGIEFARDLILFGYTKMRGTLSPHRPTLIRMFEQAFEGAKDGGEHRLTRLSYKKNFSAVLRQTKEFREFCHALANPCTFVEEYNRLRGNSHWHRDGETVPANTFKACCYLDSIGPGLGALSIVPLSHHRPDLWTRDLIASLPEGDDRRPTAKLHVELSSEPGDIIIFNSSCVHGSWGGAERRQIAATFVDRSWNGSQFDSFALSRLISGTVRFADPRRG